SVVVVAEPRLPTAAKFAVALMPAARLKAMEGSGAAGVPLRMLGLAARSGCTWMVEALSTPAAVFTLAKRGLAALVAPEPLVVVARFGVVVALKSVLVN